VGDLLGNAGNELTLGGENSEGRRGARQGPLAAARVRSTLLPIDERFGGLVGEPVFGVLP
jgi:hypothetical protein